MKKFFICFLSLCFLISGMLVAGNNAKTVPSAFAAEVLDDQDEQLEAEIKAAIPNVIFRPGTYGTLTDSKTPDKAQILANTAAIQAAIDAAVKAKGGIIEIPAGYYRVTTQRESGPPNNGISAGMIIRGDSTPGSVAGCIWLRGAGKDKTTVETESKPTLYNGNNEDVTDAVIGTGDPQDPSTYNGTVDKYAVTWFYRGHGIQFDTNGKEFKNIIISDFEMCTTLKGFTGDDRYGAPMPELVGWDRSMNAVRFTGGNNLIDCVLFQNMYIHEYRGEMLYAGGATSMSNGLQRLIVDKCTVTGTNGSNINVQGRLTLKNSTFGECRMWSETVAEYSGSYIRVLNNYFYKSNNRGFQVTESPESAKVHTNCYVLFYGNTFDNTQGASNLEGIFVKRNSWNVIVRKNTFINCLRAVYSTSIKGECLIFEDNEVYNTLNRECEMVLMYYGMDLQVLNNVGYASNGGRIMPIKANLNGGNFQGLPGNQHYNSIVRGNRPGNDAPGSLIGSIREAEGNKGADRPLYIDNTYSTVPKANVGGIIQVNAEYLQLSGSGTVKLLAELYQDGQPLTITGGSGAVFMSETELEKTGLVMKQERTLYGDEKIELVYKLFDGKWHEVGFYNGSSWDYTTVTAPDRQYTVTYNGNGATGGSAPVDTNLYASLEGAFTKDKGTLVKDGYSFLCWDTSPTVFGQVFAENSRICVKGNITLYAHWAKSGDKIFSDNQTSGDTDLDISKIPVYFTMVDGTIKSLFFKTGTCIDSVPDDSVVWYLDPSFTIPLIQGESIVEKGMMLYAKPIPPPLTTVTVIFNMSGKGTNMTITVEIGSRISVPDFTMPDGYKVEWYSDRKCTVKWDFKTMKATEDMTLYAKWTKIDNGDGNGDGNGNGNGGDNGGNGNGSDNNGKGGGSCGTTSFAGSGGAAGLMIISLISAAAILTKRKK